MKPTLTLFTSFIHILIVNVIILKKWSRVYLEIIYSFAFTLLQNKL